MKKTRTDIVEYLERQEKNYDPELCMIGKTWVSPGYHSDIPSGSWIHPTLDSLKYAAALLSRHGSKDLERSADIVRRVIALQEESPTHDAYGVWPWMYEQPLERMSPPDKNWADFCGNALMLILQGAGQDFPSELVELVQSSIRRAAHAIFRRNVGPNYTNIAIMGGVMTACAGELLGEDWLLDYGRARLTNVVAHTTRHGDFTEYNSPTYTMVALDEAERGLYLSTDPAVRASCETLRRHAWEVIASHFHPATGQWAGPHSRAYSDLLLPPAAKRIARSTGLPVPNYRREADERAIIDVVPGLLPELRCPDDLLDRFSPTSEERVTQSQFWLGNTQHPTPRAGYTWLGSEACLGSVNADSLWTQRRGVIGYWLAEGHPAVFRVRALKDGRDFASMAVLSSQQKNEAVVAILPSTGLGDYHVTLDRSEDGCYELSELVVRFSVTAPQAAVVESAEIFVLSSGDWSVVISPIEAMRGGNDLTWRTGRTEYQGDQMAYVEVAVVSEAQSFCPKNEHDTRVVANLSVQRKGAPVHSVEARIEAAEVDPGASQRAAGGMIRYSVGGRELLVPRGPAHEPNP